MNNSKPNKIEIENQIVDIIQCLKAIANADENLLLGHPPIVALDVIATIETKLDKLREAEYQEPEAKPLLIDVIRKTNEYIKKIDSNTALSTNNNEAMQQLKSALKNLVSTTRLQAYIIEKRDRNYRTASDYIRYSKEEIDKLRSNLHSAQSELNDSEKMRREREIELLVYIEAVENRILTIEDDYKSEIEKIDDLYEEKKSEIEKKQHDINNLFKIASGNLLSGNYEKRAATEEKTANWLRNISLGLMILIILLLSWSLYETNLKQIDWHTLLFKLIVSIMLSVPATYLARESNKHRNEHQYYLSKALDINAIDPYISLLPEEDKHKLKSKIAMRLFAARKDVSQESNDLPINAHEIILKLIDKSEIKIEPK